jgi:cytochrome c-type biogenesis protein CcmH/NrfF
MRSELEAGKAPEVILNEVFQKFGDEYRAVPRFSGVGMFVWIAPIAFVALGLMVAVGVSLRRKRASPSAGVPAGSSLSPEEEKKIQEELSRLE